MTRYFLLIAMVACSSLAFGQQQADLIRAARNKFNAAIRQRDLASMSSFVLPDYIIQRGNLSRTFGKDSVQAAWEKLFRANANVYFIRTPNEVIVSRADTVVWEQGTWEGFHTYSKGGRYAAVWKRRHGTWKLFSEVFVALD